MEGLISLCNDSLRYPRNFAHRGKPEYMLESYHARINEHQQRLFSSEDKSALIFGILTLMAKVRWYQHTI